MAEVKPNGYRVLIADHESITAIECLAEFLRSKGFEVRTARNGIEVDKCFESWTADFVIYDMMLPELNGLEFLKKIKAKGLLGEDKIKVFVISRHNSPANIRECLRNGASDYLVKPVKDREILARLILHIQSKKNSNATKFRPEDHASAQYYLHLTDLLLREALKPNQPGDILYNIMGLLGLSMKAVRVSLVQCKFEELKGNVISSNDNRNINGLEINLSKYPEILFVLSNEKLLAVDNLASDPTLSFLAKTEKEVNFTSMVVCPIRIDGVTWGVVSVRMPDTKQKLTEFEIRYAQLVAHVTGLVLRSMPAATPVAVQKAA